MASGITNKQLRNESPVYLGTKSVGKLLWQYSLPAIVASLAASLYNIVDSIFIGRGVGAMAITGLSITFPLMNLLVAFCTLVYVGAATMSSIFLGQQDKDAATVTANRIVLLCLVHAIFFGGVSLIFLDPILRFFGATDVTLPYAEEFMRVILYGTPIFFVFLGLNNLMRATGYPRKAMISALLSVAVNVVLAPIFIFKLKWGIAGAAWATVCGQTCALIWVVIHFLSKKSYIRLNFSVKKSVPGLIRRIYSIGLSPFLMNCCACFIVVFLNKSLLDYGGADGNLCVGAYGILNRTTMCFIMIVFGITQGMQPILGYNYGAGNRKRVVETLRKGVIAGTVITTIGWLCTELFPDAISSFFTTDESMIRIARDGFRIYFIFYPVVGSQIVIQNFFQSVGRPKISIFLSLTRQLIFLLPLLYLLPEYWGVDGIWASMAGSDVISALLAAVVAIVLMRKYMKEGQTTGHITPEAPQASQQSLNQDETKSSAQS